MNSPGPSQWRIKVLDMFVKPAHHYFKLGASERSVVFGQPFIGGAVGLGRVQQGSSPTQDAPAFIIKAGINLPSASGAWAFGAVVGYGDFGGSIPGQSNKCIFFNLPISFGMGTNAAASQAKLARRQKAAAKKQAKLLAAQLKK